jgi:hypothetical protein
MFARKIPMLLMAMVVAGGSLFHAAAYGATVTLAPEEEADLIFMREEEKLARDTYLTLYELWGLAVFSNIASSEQMHMNALLRLLKKYDLPDPAAETEIGEFADPELQALYDALIAKGEVSGLEALLVGGIIEETDMRDIKAAIERSQQDDIEAVYENLLCGSRNHLRSFAQNIASLTAEPYQAQVLSQADVDEILESPMEKCGKSTADGNAVNACKGKCLGWMK